MVVYTTPSKAVFQTGCIPQRYLDEKVDAKRAIDVFNEEIAKTDIVYLNSSAYLENYKNEEWPIFYNTGIHWSRPAEQLISQKITELIAESYSVPVKTIQLTELQKQTIPYWRDADVYDLLNIWCGKMDTEYYQFSIEANVPETYTNYNVLLQGGSFGKGLKKDFLESHVGYQFYNVFYDQVLIDSRNVSEKLTSWDDMSLGELLDKTDVVIIEINEAALKNQSNGFVAYLNQYLDNYKPQKVEPATITKLDTAMKENENLEIELSEIFGFYPVENDFYWIEPYASVWLKNNEIQSNGLKLDLTIPEYLSNLSDGKDSLKIYVNGVLKKELSLRQAGRQVLNIPMDQNASSNDVYTVELYSSKSFIPRELGINDDNRELAIQIHYIGEDN